MNNPPTGTVTLFFSDIEGSTKLQRQHAQAMPDALARHHALSNGLITSHDGYVFQIISDAFCAAFPTAGDALAAALAVYESAKTGHWVEIDRTERKAKGRNSLRSPRPLR